MSTPTPSDRRAARRHRAQHVDRAWSQAERARVMRKRADAEAPSWWPRRALWAWRWVFRPVGRLISAVLDGL